MTVLESHRVSLLGMFGIQELIILAVIFLIFVLPAVVVVRLMLFGLTNNTKHINSIPFAWLFRGSSSAREMGQATPSPSAVQSESRADQSLIPQHGIKSADHDEAWFIDRDNKHFGPYTVDQVRQFVAEGSVNQETLIRHVHSLEWMPAGEVPELF